MANPLFISTSVPAIDLNGEIAGAATITFYRTGTLDLADIFDADGDAADNPVLADQDGRFPNIYLDPDVSTYRYILKDQDGETIDDVDPYTNPYGPFNEFLQELEDEGANLINYNLGVTGSVDRTLQDKLNDTKINVKDFGAKGDGVTDDSAAVAAAVAYAVSLAVTISGFKCLMPAIYFPSGKFLITVVGAFTGAYSSGGPYLGVSFVGAGKSLTEITYSSTSNSSTNYLMNFENCSHVSVCDMTIRSTDSDLRCILWGPSGGGSGNGTGWTARSLAFEGAWTEVFTVQGTALGSETKWFDCSLQCGFASGSMFYIKQTNKQSVNHYFFGCNIGGYGTMFKLRAGGLIGVYGGFSSLYEGATYFDCNGVGADIGVNSQIVFDHVGYETTPGVINATMLNSDSAAQITFRNCAFGSLNPSGTNPLWIMGTTGNQRGGLLTFDKCSYPLKKSTFSNGVTIKYLDCMGMGEWQTYLTLQAGTNSAYLTPWVEIDGSQIDQLAGVYNPADCYPGMFINSYGTYFSPTIQFRAAKPKYWFARNGIEGLQPGLVTGFNDTYQGFSFKVPLGSIIRRVWFHYDGIGQPAIVDERDFYVDNFDGSILFLPPFNITALACTTPQTYESDYIGYHVDSEAKRVVRIYGKTPYGSGGPTTGDFGGLLVEYI